VRPAYPMFITAQTKITLPMVSLTMGDIETLLPICKTGIPEEITPELREALETLVCLAINPLRYIA
jgi:hypothetical protein